MSWFPAISTMTSIKQILQFLHLANNKHKLPQNDANHDKLFNHCNLASKFTNTFYKIYGLQRKLCIDEQMIGTKSCVSFIQYMSK